MNNHVPYYFKFLLFFLSPTLTAVAQTSVKHALIIANSSYDETKTNWKKLSSVNDIILIENSLKNQNFKNDQITILKDVTAQGIVVGLTQLSSRVRPGDIVVIHYSGHGVQLQDDNGDEPDGLDEALVPIDAVYDPKELDTGKYLRDDQLGEIFYDIRKKLGKNGHLLVFLDSCHSGSGLRGNQANSPASRGDKPPLVKAGFQEKKAANTYSQSLDDVPVRSRGNETSELSKLILFAGASSNENNYETYADGKSVGSLSYAMSKVLNQLSPNDTYRQVFAKIRFEMAVVAPRQSPVIEGDVDFRFFGGEAKKQEPYFEVVKRLDGQSVRLNAGSLKGLNEGDIFMLDTAGRAPNKIADHVLTGEITEVDYFTSTLNFKKPLPSGFVPERYWAYCTNPSFRNTSVAVSTGIPRTISSGFKALSDSLRSWPFVSLDPADRPTDVTVKATGTSLAILELPDSDLPFMNMKPVNVKDARGIADFKKALLSFAQAKFLKSLQLSSEDTRMELTLVRVNATVQSDEKFTINKIYDTSPDTVSRIFSENDQFLVKVSNVGKTKAYYNIVSIQPDNKITAVIPSYGLGDMNSYVLNPGESVILKSRLINGFFPPYGTEVMKLFATTRPIDLYPLIETQGHIATKGEVTALEKLLLNHMSNNRGPRINATANTGSSYDYVYTIVLIGK